MIVCSVEQRHFFFTQRMINLMGFLRNHGIYYIHKNMNNYRWCSLQKMLMAKSMRATYIYRCYAGLFHDMTSQSIPGFCQREQVYGKIIFIIALEKTTLIADLGTDLYNGM